jgi:hypothetical protein
VRLSLTRNYESGVNVILAIWDYGSELPMSVLVHFGSLVISAYHSLQLQRMHLIEKKKTPNLGNSYRPRPHYTVAW